MGGPHRFREVWAALGGVGFLLGVLVVLQVRSVREIRQQRELPSRRVEELAALVAQAETARKALEAEVADLQRRLQNHETLVAEGRALGAALAQELERQRMVLGLVPVRGPGIEVRLEAGARPLVGLPGGQVQATELAGLVNELWASGAEAVAVGGRRVLARSGFRQSGPRILIDGVPLSPPYVIQAIGDAALMEAALRTPGGVVEGLRSVGIVVRIRRVLFLRLPAYTGPLGTRWAKPVP
ncbi:MAG: DUF881 domain-containing protein [Armatimonadetes bacterium]|nr:DUF881 domain-containing protein [Armatimonadota bacterium]MDW8152977.1 DUF881 domain-containing protein [Armatimonadota bacterium]